jgi:hypothetical protein
MSKEVLTRDGRLYRGVMIYESPAATLLQTSPDTTVRLRHGEILEVRDSRDSFMPERLLDGLSETEVADLLAFLRTLDG